MSLTAKRHRIIDLISDRGFAMALLSQLVATCEEQRVDTGPTLSMFARRLREAGRVSKAGRGRGAAHMTFLDAARFLIACAATDHPERAVDAEFVFSNTVISRGYVGGQFVLDETSAPTLDVGLALVLEAIADGRIDAAHRAADANFAPGLRNPYGPFVWFVVSRFAVSANLHVLDREYVFQHPTAAAALVAPHYDLQVPLLQAFDRETYRFRSGKNLIAELKIDLLRAVADLVAGKSKVELPNER